MLEPVPRHEHVLFHEFFDLLHVHFLQRLLLSSFARTSLVEEQIDESISLFTHFIY